MQSEPVLQVKGLSKSFPGVKALNGVRLEVEGGQVHAVMGENGAGKSTLMKILIGLHAPDSGEIWLKGKRISIHSPHQALQLGIAMIHQELMPFPDLTVAENILMGQEPASRVLGWIDKKALHRQAKELLERLRIVLDPNRKMRELSVAEMQTVEIAKALAHNAEVIIMDEPTSAISAREVEVLFEIIRDLLQHGVAVIYISHKLDEIFRIADQVTVLRDGAYVATHGIGELDSNKLISLMVGRELNLVSEKSSPITGDVVLKITGFSRSGKFQDISFELRRGEILGLAGLMGAGRTDLANAIFGLTPAEAGQTQVCGQIKPITNPREAIGNGIALVSEDRKKYGLVLKMSAKHNLTLSSLGRCCRNGFIHPQVENRLAEDQIKRFSIKCSGRNQLVKYLSGGNQQKLVLAKALLTNPAIIILDEPTRGIDIGAKAEIYRLIGQLAAEGKAILLISSELPEILTLSDRILVMRQGAITAELSPIRTNQEEILHYAMPV